MVMGLTLATGDGRIGGVRETNGTGYAAFLGA